MSSIRFLGFGLTGRTGVHFVPMALKKGHQIVAFVRNPKKVPDAWTENKNFQAIRADPPDAKTVAKAIAEHKPHVIVSMLSSDNKPHNAVSGCGRAVVAALAELKLEKPPRFIFIAGRGLGDTHKQLTTVESVTRGAFALFYGAAIKDFELSLKELVEAKLVFTALVPGLLNEDAFTGRYLAVPAKNDGDARIWSGIGRPDLAHCTMLLGEAAAAGVDIPIEVAIRSGPKDGKQHPGWIPASAGASAAAGSDAGVASAGAGAAGESKQESKGESKAS